MNREAEEWLSFLEYLQSQLFEQMKIFLPLQERGKERLLDVILAGETVEEKWDAIQKRLDTNS
jgi:hypothetical protein